MKKDSIELSRIEVTVIISLLKELRYERDFTNLEEKIYNLLVNLKDQ